MTRWEYKQYINIKEEEMNKLGAEGWELVSVVLGNTGRTFYFKRTVS